MYSRSAKGGGKGDPNRNPWLAKMAESRPVKICRSINHSVVHDSFYVYTSTYMTMNSEITEP
jgi:hypothetical protein